MTTLNDILKSIILPAERVEDLKRDELESIIQENTVVGVRGLIDPQTIRDAKTRIRESLRVDNDSPSTGESPGDLRSNFQKFCLSGGDMRERDFPKCLRTFYNPLWADDIYGMREAFRVTAQVRNLMMGMPLNFAIDDVEKGFWTAARVHQYPAGGGFMAQHKEDYIPAILEEFGIESYYQPLIIMSKKGDSSVDPDCDFETGGGFFMWEGAPYHYEEATELGDIVIYDTRVLHGVTEIDIRKPFRQDGLNGRFAGFVTMYRDLNAKK